MSEHVLVAEQPISSLVQQIQSDALKHVQDKIGRMDRDGSAGFALRDLETWIDGERQKLALPTTDQPKA